MKNVVVICIYNRKENLKHWLHCWSQCVQCAQLVIIHSTDGERYEVPPGIIYLPRPNKGFDIGKFQDVCRDRMPGFPEWDNLLWITDDTFPMRKDFAQIFFDLLSVKRTGVVCMELSPEVRLHIRTTGFAISREVANRLQFPVDPILTKDDCYAFEHRHRTLTLYDQINRMGLAITTAGPSDISPLWDSGYHLRKRREVEHYALFGRTSIKLKSAPLNTIDKSIAATPKVVFICPIYDKYPQIISSLICQTYENWELHLVHDGPNKLDIPKDKRIIYTKVERKGNDYGHTIRKEWLQKVSGDYVVVTNPDNYHTPTYIESMLKPHKNGIVASYCSQMVHSYIQWGVIQCRLARGFLDSACVMMKLDVAKQVGWNSVEHSADWFFFEAVMKKHGTGSFAKVPGCLLVHN